MVWLQIHTCGSDVHSNSSTGLNILGGRTVTTSVKYPPPSPRSPHVYGSLALECSAARFEGNGHVQADLDGKQNTEPSPLLLHKSFQGMVVIEVMASEEGRATAPCISVPCIMV